jgi:FkbM family methyltransferase
LFKGIVKEGMVVVDIGANIGYYTLIAAKLVGKSGIVYVFEPMPSNYECLCKNIEVNGYTNVVLIQKAVSNKYGIAKVWFEKDWSGSFLYLQKIVS